MSDELQVTEMGALGPATRRLRNPIASSADARHQARPRHFGTSASSVDPAHSIFVRWTFSAVISALSVESA
jgi:hypothetical protein